MSGLPHQKRAAMGRVVAAVIAIGSLCGLAWGQPAAAPKPAPAPAYDKAWIPAFEFMEKNCGSGSFDPDPNRRELRLFPADATVKHYVYRITEATADQDVEKELVTMVYPKAVFSEGAKEVSYFLVYFDKETFRSRASLKTTFIFWVKNDRDAKLWVVDRLGMKNDALPQHLPEAQMDNRGVKYDGSYLCVELAKYPTSPVIVQAELTMPERSGCEVCVGASGRTTYAFPLKSPKYISPRKE